MKRLRDIEDPSPLLKRAQEMIDTVKPLPDSHERMLRVRRELDRPRGLMIAIKRLPALAMAGFVVLFGATAFAAVRIYVAMSEPAELAPQSQPASNKTHARLDSQPEAEPEAQDALQVAAQPQAETVAETEAETAQGATRQRETAGRASTRARTSAAPQAVLAYDSELVHRAVKALRRDGDPALAARLLEEHRARNPAGPLAEEALSLRIEAASALGDARARKLAREYVTRYPHGRYLKVAERALGDSGTSPDARP